MSQSRRLVVAIDGPAGSGKSTIAARLAKRLGYTNLESGAMYRALALKALEENVPLDDGEDLRSLALASTIVLEPAGDGNRVLLDGRDVSQRIREADVTTAASRVSVHPRVRQVMVSRQRALGSQGGVVMEGRDIGTAVFPGADVKIFLDADPNIRAERRLRQTALKSPREARRLRSEIADRDLRDRTRRNSPLTPAADAVVLDTTHMSIDDVVSAIYGLVQQQLETKHPASI